MSQDGWAYMPPAQPRTCDACGAAIRLSGKTNVGGWFRTFPVPQTLCHPCSPKWELVSR